MKLDKHNEIEVRRAIDPQVATDNTALVSQVIDMANLVAMEFVIALGNVEDADTTAVILVEHGDTTGVEDGAVADDYLLGTEAGQAIAFGDDYETRKIGYKGYKRYVRLTITPADNTGNLPICAMALCFPRVLPAD